LKKLLKITLTVLFTTILLLGFAVPVNLPNGTWYQQFLPPINNRPISDIIFLDSLTGFAVTPYVVNDTAYILKSTNGGDNWDRVFVGPTNSIGGFNKVQFLNLSTGYVCGNFLRKTTNGGLNWFTVNTSGIFPMYMRVWNEDTIWLIDSDVFAGGVFFTSNGGFNWQQQFSDGNQNPNKIYMYNARIGFMSNSSALPNIYKTTNGGANWVVNVSGQYIRDMFFIDSLTGWYSHGTGVYKTTNCGNNWITQILPTGGNIFITGVNKFSALNKDTLWAVGGVMAVGSGSRGILYRTIDGGNNWLFNLPDTSINNFLYYHLQFVNKRIGWAYSTIRGIHTTNGGDTNFLTGIQQISNEITENFKLYQNYPNPFNPVTNIGFRIAAFGFVTLKIFDITGSEVVTLINEELRAGEYKTDWNASVYSSGVYFYSLLIGGVPAGVKTMILLK